jgi:hypothetical protein
MEIDMYVVLFGSKNIDRAYQTIKNKKNYLLQEIGFTMATPCNGITECFDKSDENDCNFPNWLLPSLLSLAAIVLIITCFISLQIQVNQAINCIMQDSRWRLATQNTNSRILCITSEKLMKVASFIENGNVDEINKLLINEIKAHGNEAEVMCCMKVINFKKI